MVIAVILGGAVCPKVDLRKNLFFVHWHRKCFDPKPFFLNWFGANRSTQNDRNDHRMILGFLWKSGCDLIFQNKILIFRSNLDFHFSLLLLLKFIRKQHNTEFLYFRKNPGGTFLYFRKNPGGTLPASMASKSPKRLPGRHPEAPRGTQGTPEAPGGLGGNNWYHSQLECKGSIKMMILLCVFEGPSQIHYYLQAKLLPHSVDAAVYTSRPL